MSNRLNDRGRTGGNPVASEGAARDGRYPAGRTLGHLNLHYGALAPPASAIMGR